MLIFKLFFILLFFSNARANCEFATVYESFHTIADYKNSIWPVYFKFIDQEAFVAGKYIPKVTSLEGIDCPNFKAKFFEGDRQERHVLKISGCKKEDLNNGKFVVYNEKLVKIKGLAGRDKTLTSEQVKTLFEEMRNRELNQQVMINENPRLEIFEQKLTLPEFNTKNYEVKHVRSFDVFGKELIWYVLTSNLKYSIARTPTIGSPHFAQRENKDFKVKAVFEDVLPIVLYRYNNELNYFGNGLSTECGFHEKSYYYGEKPNPGEKIQNSLPYFLPETVYLLGSSKDSIIISGKSLSWSYQWTIAEKNFGFAVLKHPFEGF